MPDFLSSPSPFLQKVIAAVEEHLAEEAFSVTDLADQVSMSRSNLLRKVKQETGLSVSVLIREIRLHHAKLLLQEGFLTASEVSYKVGFSSTSYFTKCFRELYGYTPGEEARQSGIEEEPAGEAVPLIGDRKRRIRFVAAIIASFVAVMVVSLVLFQDTPKQHRLPKSIAVLPFKNDSGDSTNVYLMNGIMEAILDNFQKIQDIKVISRTSVEKYRGLDKTISELSKELNVRYFVEGSGQKVGNEILLTIQLIDAASDRHIWSGRYKREIEDIFQLQSEIAKSIAGEVDALITPDEYKRIERIPTTNLQAYDHYLKGLGLVKDESGKGLILSIEQFKIAIQQDEQFANAYAYIAIAYYYLDLFQADKKYSRELRYYADKAIQLDPKLGESLIAKALNHMQRGAYDLAIASFEEVLSYYPNSSWVHNFLSDIYTSYLPNTEKYLSHALRGIQHAVAEEDSGTASFTYLHLSNALAQTGFIDEAEKYIIKSLAYNSANLFSEIVYAYIQLAQEGNWSAAKASLIETLQKDTTRLDVAQEIAKVCYSMKDYEESWKYYAKVIHLRKVFNMDVYRSEELNIGFVLDKLGRKEEAKYYFDRFLAYAEADESIYKDLSLSAYYAVMGDTDLAVSYLQAFSEMENYQYWFVLFLDNDPIIMLMSGHPDFEQTIKKIEDQFWVRHTEIRKLLEAEEVI